MRAAETVPTIFRTRGAESTRAAGLCAWPPLVGVALWAASSLPPLLSSTTAHAQPAAEPPPASSAPDAPVVGSPVAPQPVVQATTPEREPALAEPKPVAPPPAPEKLAPKLKVGIGVRTGLSLSVNNPSDDVRFNLDDGIGDQLLIRPYFSGQLTENIGVVANFQIVENGKQVGFTVMDAIAQVKIADEFQIWVGQHIPANDRTNFSGPFFHNGWQFPIAVPSFPFDAAARARGFTFWGLIAEGLIKYHLSMVDLQPGRSIENARFGARVTINLLDPENYYYASGTYYGAQDVLAIGGVVQAQKGIGGVDAESGRELDNDFLGGEVDLLFEKRYGAAGTFTLEGGYWNFNGTGRDYKVNQGTPFEGLGITGPHPGQAMTAVVSWLTPDKIGIGHIQPNFRVQWADYKYDGEAKVYDAGIGYIVDGFNHRWHLSYRHADRSSGKEDLLQLGAQMQL